MSYTSRTRTLNFNPAEHWSAVEDFAHRERLTLAQAAKVLIACGLEYLAESRHLSESGQALVAGSRRCPGDGGRWRDPLGIQSSAPIPEALKEIE